MPPSITFGGADSLHTHILKFAARSPTEVRYNGETSTIHHTQFGSYDIRELFCTIVAETELDPRWDREFSTELTSAVENADACITDHDLTYHYTQREFIDPHDIDRAATDYLIYHTDLENGHLPRDCVRPRARTRRDAIAELLSLYYAQQAASPPGIRYAGYTDEDADHQPNPGVHQAEAACVIREIAYTAHGPTVFRQPDPSLHTVQKLYDLYHDIGIKPTVRGIYGVFVDPSPPQQYEPHDADRRRTMKKCGSSILGRGETAEKWTSNEEPPLETLESYREQHQTRQTQSNPDESATDDT